MYLKILKSNANPFRSGSNLERAWRITRGYGGCAEAECIAAFEKAGLARHGESQVGNRGYLRQFHRKGLLKLPGYEYRPK